MRKLMQYLAQFLRYSIAFLFILAKVMQLFKIKLREMLIFKIILKGMLDVLFQKINLQRRLNITTFLIILY